MQPDVSNQTPNAPAPASAWPGAFGIYKQSKAAVMFNLGTLLGFLAIYIGLYIVSAVLLRHSARSLGTALQTVIAAALWPAVIVTLFAGLNRQKLTFGEAYKQGGPLFLRYLIMSFLLAIIYVASFLLLVVPFFFVAPRLVLAPYYLVRKRLGVFDAISASWTGTKGHVGKVYGIFGVSVLIVLPSLTIIGFLATMYLGLMYMAAVAILYTYIAEQSGASTPPAAPATIPPQPAPYQAPTQTPPAL